MNTTTIVIAALIIVLLFVVPYQRRKRRYENALAGDKRNGTQNDVAIFLKRLIDFARKSKVRVVTPAAIRFDGKVANIPAIIVGHGRVLGICCLGFGGTIRPSEGAGEWRQELNGKVQKFTDPLGMCEELSGFVESAMEKCEVPISMKTVVVFTTPDVVIDPLPQDVFTVDGFFYYLENADWVKTGTLDMEKIADTLTSLVPADEMKAAVNEKEKKARELEKEQRKLRKAARSAGENFRS